MPSRDAIKSKKLPFLLGYFDQCRKISIPKEEIIIERLVIPMEEYTKIYNKDFWYNLDKPLTKRMEVKHGITIEDTPDSTIVDFANKFIGGGSLDRGSVQEEILFLIYPELSMTVLFCEKMEANEAIFVGNV
jgi:poly(ADP-ribose) glycohydrolase